MKKFALLALAYATTQRLHRRLGLRTTVRNRELLLPLITIGALRSGGSGKTPVTLELARQLSAQGLRIGVLACWLRKTRKKSSEGIRFPLGDLAEVTEKSDWRDFSDEAVLLVRSGEARVFVTRNRERAWDQLSRLGELDALISDDGLMDPRLRESFRIVLRRPEESPGLFDLLPAGPYRMTSNILKSADCVVTGPLSEAPGAPQPPEFWFRRKLLFPEGYDPRAHGNQGLWVLCGLGHPEAFYQDLIRAAVRIVGRSFGPDHGLPNLRRAGKQALKHHAGGFICTAKDWVKLESRVPELGTAIGSVVVVGERIELDPNLVAAVGKYLESRVSSRHIFVN